MAEVKRIYVEKKEDYAVAAKHQRSGAGTGSESL